MASAAFIAEPREMRVRISSRKALEAGVDRAEREPWVARCRVDRFRRELVIELAGGFGVRPPLRVMPLPLSDRPN
jgi:hypothetical protein